MRPRLPPDQRIPQIIRRAEKSTPSPPAPPATRSPKVRSPVVPETSQRTHNKFQEVHPHSPPATPPRPHASKNKPPAPHRSATESGMRVQRTISGPSHGPPSCKIACRSQGSSETCFHASANGVMSPRARFLSLPASPPHHAAQSSAYHTLHRIRIARRFRRGDQ